MWYPTVGIDVASLSGFPQEGSNYTYRKTSISLDVCFKIEHQYLEKWIIKNDLKDKGRSDGKGGYIMDDRKNLFLYIDKDHVYTEEFENGGIWINNRRETNGGYSLGYNPTTQLCYYNYATH